MVDLKEATDYLFANGYLHSVKGEFKLTVKFRKAMDALAAGHSVAKSNDLVPVKYQEAGIVAAKVDWVAQYKQFIIDANVPKRCEGRNGEMYATNTYSEPGMKAFRKAIESGTNYEMLVASTALYYKSGIRMKVAIGRYMEEGRWRTDYDALVASAENNTVKEHIQSETDNGEHTFTKLG